QSGGYRSGMDIAGYLLIVLSMDIVIWAAWVFHTHKTPIMPDRTPQNMITSGPYRFSRNPIYLAMLITLLGLGLIFATFMAIPVALIFAVLVTHFHIKHEETVISAKYADEATAYFARTPRWVGPF
ncbi:MAG: methyltransferase family protein, partial [Planktomarina sp.]